MLASLRPQLKRSVVLAGIRDSVIADPARRSVRLWRGVVAELPTRQHEEAGQHDRDGGRVPKEDLTSI